eukprot:4113335-Amphidinium_carterae.1
MATTTMVDVVTTGNSVKRDAGHLEALNDESYYTNRHLHHFVTCVRMAQGMSCFLAPGKEARPQGPSRQVVLLHATAGSKFPT